MSTPTDVSVIIVNWNTREILRDCLASVFEQTPSAAMEVIVIDNASSDGSVEMVQTTFPQVVLIANPDNRGFATANNQGIAIATGRYILLLNSDTVVLDRAIEKTIAYGDTHRDSAAIGCRVLNPDRTLQHSCFMFPSLLNWLLMSSYLYKIFPRSRFFGRERMTWWQRDDEREVDVVTGCYMLIPREAMTDIGMLDEGFFMYAEETDWCYRAKVKGWKNRFMPGAEIIHIGGASSVKMGPARARAKNNAFRRYMFKHWSKPKAVIGIGLMGLFYASRLAILLPRRLIARDVTDGKLLANHWVGLVDILRPGR